MQHHSDYQATSRTARYNATFLFCAFILGQLVGANIAFHNQNLFDNIIQVAIYAPRSIAGTFGYVLAPFALTAIHMVTSTERWFVLICLVQSIYHGTLITATFCMYGSSCWLIVLLLTFSSTISQICLLWFWLHHITCSRNTSIYVFVLTFIFSLICAIIDILIISPYTVTLSV